MFLVGTGWAHQAGQSPRLTSILLRIRFDLRQMSTFLSRVSQFVEGFRDMVLGRMVRGKSCYRRYPVNDD